MSNSKPPSSLWTPYLSAEEAEKVTRAGFARRAGAGTRPALLLIDVQKYMIGSAALGEGELAVFPSSCGEAGRLALKRTTALLAAARRAGIPVIYTKFELAADGSDAGVYRRKRTILPIYGWCLEGTPGADIADEIAPAAGEFVLVKKKPSAFVGTPLLQLLIDRGVDTVIVAGGSTSNCVRATVVDAVSLNFRALIPADCVFDRFAVSHAVSLFDLDRQYGDVMWSEEITSYLQGLGGRD